MLVIASSQPDVFLCIFGACREAVLRRLAEVAPHFARGEKVEPPVWLNGQVIKALGDKAAAAGSGVLKSPIENFFMTDAISRASQTMAKCVQARQQMRVAA